MELVICVDDGEGMLFNKRRQSRDRKLVENLMASLGEKELFIFDFSKFLFEGEKVSLISSDDVSAAKDGCLFLENGSVSELEKDFDKLVVYHWNRAYPSDFKCDYDYRRLMKLESSFDFEGSSHEKITKEVYVK